MPVDRSPPTRRMSEGSREGQESATVDIGSADMRAVLGAIEGIAGNMTLMANNMAGSMTSMANSMAQLMERMDKAEVKDRVDTSRDAVFQEGNCTFGGEETAAREQLPHSTPAHAASPTFDGLGAGLQLDKTSKPEIPQEDKVQKDGDKGGEQEEVAGVSNTTGPKGDTTKALTRLEKFQGDSRVDKLKWRQWVKRFELRMETTRVPVGQWRTFLAEYLEGTAFKVYEGLGKVDPDLSFDSIKQKLQDNFDPSKSESLAYTQLAVTFWDVRGNEPLQDFVIKLRTLCQEGLPEAGKSTQEAIVCNYFLRNLPWRWKLHVERVCDKGDLDQYVKIAVELQMRERTEAQISAINRRIRGDAPVGQSPFGRAGFRGVQRGGVQWSQNFGTRGGASSSGGTSGYGQMRGGFNAFRGNTGMVRGAGGGMIGGRGGGQRPVVTAQAQGPVQDRSGCYTCGDKTHIARFCPKGGMKVGTVWKEKERDAVECPVDEKKYEEIGEDFEVPVEQSEEEEKNQVYDEFGEWCGTLEEEEDEEGDVYVVIPEAREREDKKKLWVVDVDVQGVEAQAVFDTGSAVTIVRTDLLRKVVRANEKGVVMKNVTRYKGSIASVTSERIPFEGRAELMMTVDGVTKAVQCLVYKALPYQLLLGDTFCEQFRVSCRLGAVGSGWEVKPDGGGRKAQGAANFSVTGGRVSFVAEQASIRARRSKVVEGRGPSSYSGKTCLLEVSQADLDEDVFVPDCLVKVGEGGRFHFPAENFGRDRMAFKKGAEIGRLHVVTTEIEGEGEEKVMQVGMERNDDRVKAIMEKIQIGEGRTRDEREAVRRLVEKFSDVFALSVMELGTVKGVEHDVPTKEGATAVRHKARPVPPKMIPELKACIQEWQEAGIVRETESDYASPIVPVKKKDGTWRLCVDYRDLNAITLPHQWPLPRIDDLLFELGQTKPKFIAKLDLKAGYLQIKLSEEARRKSAFITPWCHMEFTKMPFGMAAAPMTFQRMVDVLFKGADRTKILWFMDDFLVVGDTLESFLENLEFVFEKFREANLKVGPEKCEFLGNSVTFLGYVISEEGVQVDQTKLVIVRDYKRPQNPTQIRRFLGFVNYYRRFIPGCGKIAKPLSTLLSKEEPFVWSDACEQAFSNLKEKLLTAPVLRYVDFDKPIYLETDACRGGIGAVMAQETGKTGRLHACYYIGRATNRAEQNYAPVDLEALAVVFAIQKFRNFLWGNEVYVITDCSALAALREKRQLPPKMARWAAMIMEINPGFLYRPGLKNQAADALSRIPHSEVDRLKVEDLNEDFIMAVAPLFGEGVKEEAPQLLRIECGESSIGGVQDGDVYLCAVRAYLQTGIVPEDEQVARRVRETAHLHEVVAGVIYRRHVLRSGRRTIGTTLLIAVPEQEQARLVKEAHDSPAGGHFSAYKTYGRLLRKYFWTSMLDDCCKFCRECEACWRRGGGQRPVNPPMESVVVPLIPGDQIGMDIQKLCLTRAGNLYTVVFIDYASKYPVVVPIPDQKAETIARAMVDHWICVWGAPKVVISDQGAQIVGKVMAEVCRIFGLKQQTTTINHPQADGLAERFHRTMQAMLAKGLNGRNFDRWDEWIQPMMLGYRTTPHSSTKLTPAELMTGRQFRIPAESELAREVSVFLEAESDEYLVDLQRGLNMLWEVKQENVTSSQNSQKIGYDRANKTKEGMLQEGEVVFVKNPTLKKGLAYKLRGMWDGPYKVEGLTVTNVWVTKVSNPKGDPKCFHRSQVSRRKNVQVADGVEGQGGGSVGRVMKGVDASRSAQGGDREVALSKDIGNCVVNSEGHVMGVLQQEMAEKKIEEMVEYDEEQGNLPYDERETVFPDDSQVEDKYVSEIERRYQRVDMDVQIPDDQMTSEEAAAVVYAHLNVMPYETGATAWVDKVEQVDAAVTLLRQTRPTATRGLYSVHVVSLVNDAVKLSGYKEWNRAEKAVLSYLPFDPEEYRVPVLVGIFGNDAAGVIFDLRGISKQGGDARTQVPVALRAFLEDDGNVFVAFGKGEQGFGEAMKAWGDVKVQRTVNSAEVVDDERWPEAWQPYIWTKVDADRRWRLPAAPMTPANFRWLIQRWNGIKDVKKDIAELCSDCAFAKRWKLLRTAAPEVNRDVWEQVQQMVAAESKLTMSTVRKRLRPIRLTEPGHLEMWRDVKDLAKRRAAQVRAMVQMEARLVEEVQRGSRPVWTPLVIWEQEGAWRKLVDEKWFGAYGNVVAYRVLRPLYLLETAFRLARPVRREVDRWRKLPAAESSEEKIGYGLQKMTTTTMTTMMTTAAACQDRLVVTAASREGRSVMRTPWMPSVVSGGLRRSTPDWRGWTRPEGSSASGGMGSGTRASSLGVRVVTERARQERARVTVMVDEEIQTERTTMADAGTTTGDDRGRLSTVGREMRAMTSDRVREWAIGRTFRNSFYGWGTSRLRSPTHRGQQ